jgi:flagellin
MDVIINTNNASLFAARAVRNAASQDAKSIEKLSSGLRINRAGDDAAGLSISEKLTTKLRGIRQAERNINDAFGVLDYAYSGVEYAKEQVQRIRELWVQAENGTNGIDEKDSIQREINAIVGSIVQARDPALHPEYIKDLFQGANNTVQDEGYLKVFQVGADANDVIVLDFTNGPNPSNDTPDNALSLSGNTIIPGSAGFGAISSFGTLSVGSNIQAFNSGGTSGVYVPKNGSLNSLDTMLKNLNRMTSVINKYQAKFQSAYDKLQSEKISYSDFKSQITDADYAQVSSDFTADQIRKQSAAAVLSQANAQPSLALSLLP